MTDSETHPASGAGSPEGPQPPHKAPTGSAENSENIVWTGVEIASGQYTQEPGTRKHYQGTWVAVGPALRVRLLDQQEARLASGGSLPNPEELRALWFRSEVRRGGKVWEGLVADGLAFRRALQGCE